MKRASLPLPLVIAAGLEMAQTGGRTPGRASPLCPCTSDINLFRYCQRELIGAKPPLRPKHVGSIRTRLMVEGRSRDLALFNLAIDSKLRGCDVVALKVDDVAPTGYTIERATIRQRKTGRLVA